MQRFLKTIYLIAFCIFIINTQSIGQANADFTASATGGCTPLLINYTDISTSPNGVQSWSWDFGDGTSTTLQNPAKLYTSSGTFTICLAITDSLGLVDTLCRTNYINVSASPTVQFSGTPLSGCKPVDVQFTDMSTAGSSPITSWSWSFGDGSSSGNQNPNYSYTTVGNFNVTLQVTDQSGCTAQTTKAGYVTSSGYPTANFSPDSTSFCSFPATVNFTNSSLSPPGGVMSYLWDFGDGTTSSVTNPSHTYNTTDTFTVKLIATNTLTGCDDTMTLENLIEIANAGVLSFDYSATQGCDNLSVNFTNTTPCPSTNWVWDFGDGNTSNLENPTHNYNTPGTYTVTYTADVNGSTIVETKTNLIQIDSTPTVNYTVAGNLIGCNLPLNVNFAGISGNPTVTYAWDFGDGATSSLQNPSHQYTTEGEFPISLTVTTPQGCSSTIVKDTVKSRPIKASFLADLSKVCVGQIFTFVDSSSSYYPIVSWDWDFGDTTSTDQSPTIAFSDTGIQNISLVVTNDQGCSDSVSISGIGVGDTISLAFLADDTTICVDGDVMFTNLTDTIGKSHYLTNWKWEFGDGGVSTQYNPTYTYEDTGTYAVKLAVQHLSCVSELEILDMIQVFPPKAKFLLSRDCANPLQVTFTDQSDGADSWLWDFGDANSTADTSIAQNPVFTYPSHGTYSIKLTAFNAASGCSHEETKTVTLTPAEDVNISITPTSGCAPLDVVVNNSSSLAAYSWTAAGAVISDSTAASPIITYNNSGTYDSITLVVTHPNGCLEEIILPDLITVAAGVGDITADFTVNTVSGCTPLTVNFTDLSTSSISNIVSWTWDFGDGDSATNQNPSHVYTESGTYEVFLTVADTTGCFRTKKLTSPIIPTSPGLSLTMSDTIACPGQTVTFSGTGTGIGLSYFWNFGDGNTSTLQNPANTFINVGDYSVCLTITDINGCQNTVCDTLDVSYPAADFMADNTTSVCQNLTAQFTDLSTHATSWLWDFGDSTTSVLQNPVHVYTEPGLYDVCLFIMGPGGCTDTICKPGYIYVDGPSATYSVSDTSGCPGQDITFTAMGTNVSTFTWVFGDFTTVDVPGTNGADTISTLRSYTAGGTYFPSLVVEDNQGCVRTYISGDSIVIEDFNITINASNNVLCDTGTVAFSSTITSLTPVTNLQWTYTGTPSGVSTTDFSHFYNTPGIYPLSVTASNASCVRTVHDTITVLNKPTVNFGYTPQQGCLPLTVNFTDSSSIMNDSLVSWLWDFGNGVTDTLLNTSHTYTAANNYNVSLTVSAENGCVDSMVQMVTVHPLPVADAGTDQTICNGSSYTLQGNGGATYQWAADASLSCTTCQNPVATPTQTTTYYLTVATAQGCMSMDSVTITVVSNPVAAIGNGAVTACSGALITFQDVSTISSGTITNWNWDLGVTGTSNLQNPTQAYTAPGTYNISLMVTSDNGCTDTTSTTVTINQTPTASAIPDAFLCKGDSVQLQGFGNGTFSWSPSFSLSCSDCPNPVAFPQITTLYTLTVTSPQGCTDTDTVRVEVSIYDAPAITVSPDTTICKGDLIQLMVGGGNTVLDYEWDTDRPGLSCYTHCSNPFASPTVTTTYPVTLTGVGGCQAKDSVTVTVVEPNQSIVAGGDQIICKGESIQLVTTQGSNHIWSPFDGLSCGICPNPIASPTATTQYVVTALSSLGCDIMDTITVTVLDPAGISAGPDLGICPGDSVQLQGTGTGLISWNFDATLSSSSIINPVASPTVTTDYYLTVDNGSCIVVDTVTVFVTNKADISGEDVTICEGESVQLNVEGFASSYIWSPLENISDSSISNPIASPTETTVYTIIGNLQNCEADTTTITVNVSPAPKVEGFPIQNAILGQSTELQLVPEFNPAFTYSWYPDVDITCTNCRIPIIRPNQDTTYYVTVTNLEGCTKTDSIQIKLINDCAEDMIIVPNGFTPNNDGLNDVLYVRGSVFNELAYFRIYSRSGELVFESKDINSGWDGTHKNKPVNTGVYIYIVEVTCPVTGLPVQKRGNVTVIR